jgi:hypothetical protein
VRGEARGGRRKASPTCAPPCGWSRAAPSITRSSAKEEAAGRGSSTATASTNTWPSPSSTSPTSSPATPWPRRPRLARLAAETAALAAPYEEIPRLDLAAVAAAEGHHAEAQRIIRDEICNRTDDDNAPPELPTRTEEILRRRQGWTDTKAS